MGLLGAGTKSWVIVLKLAESPPLREIDNHCSLHQNSKIRLKSRESDTFFNVSVSYFKLKLLE